MQNQDLMDRVCMQLLRKGFTVKSLSGSCFDIVARKGTRIILLKVLSDANAVSEGYAAQMRELSRYMGASSFILAERAGSALEDNIIYTRMGIYTLNLKTLMNCIDNRRPFLHSTNAGLTACVVGGMMKQKREEEGMSLSQFSARVGVSRRMISKYEKGDDAGRAHVTMARAERIYNELGHEVFDKIDVFGQHKNIAYSAIEQKETPITRKYSDLGFEASEARKVPFNVIARRDDELILTEVGDKRNPDAGLLSKLIDAENFVIFNRKKPKDVPAMSRQEFMEFSEADDLLRFLKGF
ncbi:MAG: helix-turn-helix domain-containing protein [Candidatus Woesearchaeota archaeon]